MHFIFFFLILIIYCAACFYIARRIIRFATSRVVKIAIGIGVALLTFLMPIQRMAVDVVPEGINRVLYLVSTLWLVVVMYASIILLILGLARYIAKKKNGDVPEEKPTTMWHTLVIVCIIIVAGIFNAYNPVFTSYSVSTEMPNDTLHRHFATSVRIALVSDIHLGYAVRSGDCEKLVGMINSTEADICIIAGDVFDGDVRPVVDNDLGKSLAEIKSRFGTYAVIGNHEYMGDADVAADYIRERGITVLRDSAMKVGPFWIIGRDDLSVRRVGRERVSLDSLANRALPQIVVDHQPGALRESVEAGAFLHLSGHTHAGQVWPMNFLTGLAYDIDYGHEKWNGMDVVVTSGFGTWGPRMRLGNHAEVVVIDVEIQ